MKKIILFCFTIVNIKAFSQNVGIGTTTPAHKLEVVSAAATNTNIIMLGTNNGNIGNGILGESNNANTYGVRGLSNTGTGVNGYTSVGVGMAGTSLSGTAIFAQSISGYGLQSSGKLKFSGGNTNPTDGAILSSDATGNATWKRANLAFHGYGAANAIGETPTKVEFNSEEFDTQNNFVITPFTVNSNSSVFTAPVAGIYHFSAKVLFEKAGVAQNERYMVNGTINLILNGNTLGIATNKAPSTTHLNSFSTFSCYVYLYIDADIKLLANDKVWVQAYNEQYNDHTPTAVPLNTAFHNSSFNGELIYAY